MDESGSYRFILYDIYGTKFNLFSQIIRDEYPEYAKIACNL